MSEMKQEEVKQKRFRWIRDPSWEFIGVVVAVITFAVGYWQWSVQQGKREISYSIVSSGPLVSVDDDLNGKLRVVYDGKPVTGLALSIILVQNTGSEAIKRADYDQPIHFSLGGTPILDYQVAYQKPSNLGAKLTEGPSKTIEITPCLLNPGDSVVLKIISAGKPEIKANARIVDIDSLRQVAASTNSNKGGSSPWVIALAVVFGSLLPMFLLELWLRFATWRNCRKVTHRHPPR